MDNKSLLKWYLEAGVDEAVADEPCNQLSVVSYQLSETAIPEARTPKPEGKLHHSPSAAMAKAREMADAAQNLADLELAVRQFDGCALKKTATKTVFADGNPNAKIMVIGEAPGAQEDVQGIPFCGQSGQLLDKMLAAIGLSRAETVYISNTIFWRPPGNRQPSPEETAICLPFVEKHIALISPDLLILFGGTATNTLLNNDLSMSRLRGKFYEYSNTYIEKPIKTAVSYHPSYLLRQPLAKKQAWQDLLMVKDFLSKN